MNNYVIGTIKHVLEPITGESKRNPGTKWMRQDYVLETQDLYPRMVAFNIFGEDRIKAADIKQGEQLAVEVEINSREYEGRWYTDIRCVNVFRGEQMNAIMSGMVGGAPQPAPQAYAQTQTQNNFGPATPQPQAPTAKPASGGMEEDLPF